MGINYEKAAHIYARKHCVSLVTISVNDKYLVGSKVGAVTCSGPVSKKIAGKVRKLLKEIINSPMEE